MDTSKKNIVDSEIIDESSTSTSSTDIDDDAEDCAYYAEDLYNNIISFTETYGPIIAESLVTQALDHARSRCKKRKLSIIDEK